MHLFEQILERAAAVDAETSALLAQWIFDRKLLSKALQSVQMTFGHYSRHDSSHSNTILLQIARILGPDRVAKLTATDAWLLLEAAYAHDLGMIVTDDEAHRIWKSTPFKQFLHELASSADDEYRRIGSILLSRDEIGKSAPLDIKRYVTLALAEYTRRSHAKRSGEIVSDPSRILLESPRVLIPKRLFHTLDRICALHGERFEDALLLPKTEQGIGLDDAHPRFVACMLRIGDLLDIDDGRFCPVMNATFGRLPALSVAHREKHSSIRRFVVTPELIEVEAVCPAGAERVFDETERWFAWLRDEAMKLATSWADIAPTRRFGSFPSVGRIDVRMDGQILLAHNQRPRFEVDRESLLTLMRGSNLYRDKWECIREVVQNAIDATLIRIWLESKSKILKIAASLGRSVGLNPIAEIRALAKNYPIRVSVRRSKDKRRTKSRGRVRWSVDVLDTGTGISLADIGYLQRIGSSSKNPAKARIRHDMPEWMWPSGIFGIGLQSVFLVTSRVRLLSRAPGEPDVRVIRLRKNASDSSGGLSVSRVTPVLQKLRAHAQIARLGGTSVRFEFEAAAIPNRVSEGDRRSETAVLLTDFDAVATEELPYEAASIRDFVRMIAEHSPVPIYLDGKPCRPAAARPGGFTAFDAESLLNLTLHAGFARMDGLWYRGAPLRSSVSRRFLGIQADMYFGRAADVLQLSREELNLSGVRSLQQRLDSALVNTLPRYIKAVREKSASAEEMEALSLYGLLYGNDELKHAAEELGAWKNIQVLKVSPTFRELVALEDWTLRVDLRSGGRTEGYPLNGDWDSSKKTLLLRNSDPGTLLHAMKRYGRHIGLVAGSTKEDPAMRLSAVVEKIYRVTLREIDPLPDSGLQFLLGNLFGTLGGRVTIPCPIKFNRLRLKDDAISGTWVTSIEAEVAPSMLLPFYIRRYGRKLTTRNVPALIRWVTPRLVEASECRDVASLYIDFIEHVSAMTKNIRGGSVMQFDLQATRAVIRSEFQL